MSPEPPTILLTRPLEQAQRFAETLRETFGPDIVVQLSPVMQIVRAEPPADIAQHRYLAFTSENGVWAVSDQARPDQVAYCVGARTAMAAQMAGFKSYSADGDGPALAKMIQMARPDGPVLHVRGAELRFSLVEALAESPCQIDEVCAYHPRPCPLTEQARQLLSAPGVVILPLFSPRSAKLLADMTGPVRAELHIAALSPAVAAEAARLNPARIVISGVATGAAMLKSIAGLLDA